MDVSHGLKMLELVLDKIDLSLLTGQTRLTCQNVHQQTNSTEQMKQIKRPVRFSCLVVHATERSSFQPIRLNAAPSHVVSSYSLVVAELEQVCSFTLSFLVTSSLNCRR